MKKLLTFVLIASVGILLTGFRSMVVTGKEYKTSDSVVIPDKVMAVIKISCFGCHNSESTNKDAKKELAFDTLDSLKPFALAGVLEDIREEVKEDKMPPSKFLKKYPDKALTKDNKEIILNWVKEAEATLESK